VKGWTNRLLVLSYFEPDALAKLLGAVRAAKLPAKMPVYVGSYGVSREICEQVQALPNGRYAPMFHVQPGWYWERRRLSGRDERVLLARNPRTVRLAGPLPSLPQLLRLPSSTTRVTWGVELGARFGTPSAPPERVGLHWTPGSSTRSLRSARARPGGSTAS
jgi:hypothetical protein